MKNRQNAVLDALQRVQHFLDENASLLTGGVDLAGARRRLDEVAASFTTHALVQDVGERGRRGETAKQRQLRVKLRRQQMEPIALIARRNLRDTPEFAALQMPKPSAKGPAFLASANGMAKAAAVHHDTLVEHGLPTTFLDDFKTAVTKLEESLKERENNFTQRVGATKGLDIQEKQGHTVLGVLDSLMEQALGSNQSLLRAWESARLVRRRPVAVAPKTSATEAVAATAPTPAGVAAPAPTPNPVTATTPATAA